MTNAGSIPAPTQPNGRPVDSRRRRVWLMLLVLVVIAFIAFALPPYLTFDAARSRIPPPPNLPAYYPLLVVHVIFASIAMLAASFQIWTGLRQRSPAAHRLIGRLYVFGGVLPAGLAGLAIGSVSPFGTVLRVSNVLLAVLWLVCTFIGFRMGQRRRFEEHRRWMLRSFVLTMSIITNRVWAVIFFFALTPQLDTTFGGKQELLIQTIAGLSGWLGWVLPLLMAEWWLITRVEGNTMRTRTSAASV